MEHSGMLDTGAHVHDLKRTVRQTTGAGQKRKETVSVSGVKMIKELSEAVSSGFSSGENRSLNEET